MKKEPTQEEIRELEKWSGKSWDELQTVTELNLRGLGLKEIPVAVFYLTQLEDLDLYNNQISEVQKEIANLVNLRELSLSYNKISKVIKEIGNLKNLNTLDLRNNKIKKYPDSMRWMIGKISIYFEEIYPFFKDTKINIIHSDCLSTGFYAVNSCPIIKTRTSDYLPKDANAENSFKKESLTTKPSYYLSKDGGFDVIDFVQKNELNFTRGNVIKYIVRAGKKEGESALKDLKKAQEYIKREIEYLEKNKKEIEESITVKSYEKESIATLPIDYSSKTSNFDIINNDCGVVHND